MIPVPFASSLGTVPFHCEWTNPGKMFKVWSTVFPVGRKMIESEDAFEITDVVIAGVLIPVVDMISIWDRAVMSLPNFAVKRLHAVLNMSRIRLEIVSIGDPFGIWIPAEGDAIEDSGFDSHVASISNRIHFPQ